MCNSLYMRSELYHSTIGLLKHCFTIVLCEHIHLNRWHTTSSVFPVHLALVLFITQGAYGLNREHLSPFFFQTVCAGYIRMCFCCKGTCFQLLLTYFTTMKTLFMWISCLKYLFVYCFGNGIWETAHCIWCIYVARTVSFTAIVKIVVEELPTIVLILDSVFQLTFLMPKAS